MKSSFNFCVCVCVFSIEYTRLIYYIAFYNFEVSPGFLVSIPFFTLFIFQKNSLNIAYEVYILILSLFIEHLERVLDITLQLCQIPDPSSATYKLCNWANHLESLNFIS